jgi:predicted transcriptional regulator
MIWQEHVPVIVMITRLFEKNKVKKKKKKIIFLWGNLFR